MEIKEHKIKGVYQITMKPHVDNRGYFMRVFDNNFFKDNGLIVNWVQENQSRSERRGIIRGLHFQFPPFSEAKLVRCIFGAVMDVFVDLRKDSKTFGEWGSIELNEKNKKMIFIPRGFAHGFCTLTNVSEVIYKVDNYYAPEYEAGILWNDPKMRINWPVEKPVLSEKDKKNMRLDEFIRKYTGIDVST